MNNKHTMIVACEGNDINITIPDTSSNDSLRSKGGTKHNVRYLIDNFEYDNSFILKPVSDRNMEPYLNIKTSLSDDCIKCTFL